MMCIVCKPNVTEDNLLIYVNVIQPEGIRAYLE